MGLQARTLQASAPDPGAGGGGGAAAATAAIKDADAFTGTRSRRGAAADFDFRCFFLVGERCRICAKIDRRCEKMLESGLLEETAQLLASGVLDPTTTAAKSIGYRQAAAYLLEQPAPVDAADAVAGDEEAAAAEAEARFAKFLGGFCTVSRQYSTEQMKWFRKDTAYLWVRSELEKPAPVAHAMHVIEEAYRAERADWERLLPPEAGAAGAAGGEVVAGPAAEGQRVRALNVAETKAMRQYVPQALALRTAAKDGDGEGRAKLRALTARGEEARAALRRAKAAAE